MEQTGRGVWWKQRKAEAAQREEEEDESEMQVKVHINFVPYSAFVIANSEMLRLTPLRA